MTKVRRWKGLKDIPWDHDDPYSGLLIEKERIYYACIDRDKPKHPYIILYNGSMTPNCDKKGLNRIAISIKKYTKHFKELSSVPFNQADYYNIYIKEIELKKKDLEKHIKKLEFKIDDYLLQINQINNLLCNKTNSK